MSETCIIIIIIIITFYGLFYTELGIRLIFVRTSEFFWGVWALPPSPLRPARYATDH
jgi:hypothetical protein